MLDPHRFALQLARAVDALRNTPGAANDWQHVIAPIAELTAKQSATIRLNGRVLSVEGSIVPEEQAFIPDLIDRMTAHGVAIIQLANSASLRDLMHLTHGLASEPVGGDLATDLFDANVVDVSIVSAVAVQIAAGRRVAAPTSSTLAGPAAIAMAQAAQAALAGPPPRAGVGSAPPAGSPPPLLENILKRLRKPLASNPFDALNSAIGAIREAMDAGKKQDATEALVALVREEAKLTDNDLRLQYNLAMRNVFSQPVLRGLASMLLDQVYGKDVTTVLQRAGEAGAGELLSLLVDAPTQAERRALLGALRTMKESSGALKNMLDHHQWYVVRNVADLVGDLKVEDAIEQLGKAADHEDVRVRKSAASALARIGTPSAARYLRKSLKDSEHQVRTEAAKAIGGKAHAGLAMQLVSLLEGEQDMGVKGEFYRALGRIGTPEAVQALKKAAEPPGILRRASGPRLAAVEGLSLAGVAAESALRELERDGDREVRAVVTKALAGIKKR